MDTNHLRARKTHFRGAAKVCLCGKARWKAHEERTEKVSGISQHN